MRTLVPLLHSSGVRRLAAISAAGVGDSITDTNRVMRWLIEHSTIGAMYADLMAMESAFRQSDLDWVAVRPAMLVNSAKRRPVKLLTNFGTTSIIGRADVAAELLRLATDEAPLVNRTPMIGWW